MFAQQRFTPGFTNSEFLPNFFEFFIDDCFFQKISVYLATLHRALSSSASNNQNVATRGRGCTLPLPPNACLIPRCSLTVKERVSDISSVLSQTTYQGEVQLLMQRFDYTLAVGVVEKSKK